MTVDVNAAGCAWITGASSGLGRALARRMAADGWRIAASARGAEALADLAASAVDLEGEIHAYPLDVTDPAAVTDALISIEQDLGPIGQAVLNAGTHKPVRAATFAAFYSLESDAELRRRSVTNVTAFLETGRPENVVVEGTR